MTVPSPNPTDFARSFPGYGFGGGGSYVVPWENRIDAPPGTPWGARVSLSGTPSGDGPSTASAYELMSADWISHRLVSVARALGIRGTVRRHVEPGNDVWLYVANPVTGAGPFGHSLAVQLRTGEVLYHNLFAGTSAPPGTGWNERAAERASRKVLLSIEWPFAATVPLHVPTTPQERAMQGTVAFSWPRLPTTDVAAARLAVDSLGRVEDAAILPPIERRGSVPLRGAQSAWPAVREGKVPIATDANVGPHYPGSGSLQDVNVVLVLVRSQGRAYLVPTYRFSGPATVPGFHGTAHWIALAPATK